MSVFKFARWRRQGVVIDEVLSQYKSVGAELNVLPYCTQFIPMEVITAPRHQSICYHPSLLPLHRGASAINWSAALTSRSSLGLLTYNYHQRGYLFVCGQDYCVLLLLDITLFSVVQIMAR